MNGRAIVLQGDARHLPLPDASVDLIVTSPPYWVQRDYRDRGVSMPGQIGSEATWQEWVAVMVECTREFARVLKPTGNMFINLGDKMRDKSLMLLPQRYVIDAADQIGLIPRRDIIWAKPNGLPESVTDRCRTSHEYLFHLVKQPRYYAAIDEIREAYEPDSAERTRRYGGNPRSRDGFAGLRATGAAQHGSNGVSSMGLGGTQVNPLGKLPGSVWNIPSAPLQVPAHLGIDHFAAFPPALVRPLVLGWSPPGICTTCGEGRRPVVDKRLAVNHVQVNAYLPGDVSGHPRWDVPVGAARVVGTTAATITGYVCACAPYTDHPGRRGTSFLDHSEAASSGQSTNGSERNKAYREGRSGPSGPVREYHLDQWTPPPTRPAIVLDPFSGTGTTPLVASVLGRLGIGIDRSADYTRLAAWRTQDPGERARALDVPKPPKQVEGQETLWA